VSRCSQFLRVFVLAIGAVPFLPTTPLRAQQPLRALPAKASAPANSQALGRLPDAQTMRLAISLPLRNQPQLHTLLQQLYDPASPNYRKFLTVQQFTDQFGASAQDYVKVLDFAKSHGFTVTHTFPNRLVVSVSGPAASINQAFHVTMQRYQHPTENRTFYAPDVEPTVEAGLPILSVDGLSDLYLPRPMLKRASPTDAAPSNPTGSGPSGFFLGSDMRAAYAPGVKLNGSGQMLGLFEFLPYNLSDVQMYFSTIGQPLNVPIYNVLLDVDGICSETPATGGCDDGEPASDIEQAISMAPNLSGLIVYETYSPGSLGDPLTAFTQAATDNIAKQLSISYVLSGGDPSSNPGYEQIFVEFEAQGQNLFVSSGDYGSNLAIPYPQNSPNVTDVGGTDLTTASAGGPWQAESGWLLSGGGWNTQSPIPSYQTAVINSSNLGSTAYRNVPDVAMDGNTDSYSCAFAVCFMGLGGTSLAAPRWAGFLALANQQANGTPIGFLNPTIYRLGQGSTYNSIFHDIATGNNFGGANPNLFSAVAGYDLVTGWGSPQGQSMIDILAPVTATAANFALAASPATMNLTPGASGTSTIKLTPSNGFKGVVQFTVTVVGSPAGVTATLDQTSLTASGSTNLSVSTMGATPGGSFVLAITGTSGGLTQTAYVQLGLPDFSLSVSPTYIYLNQSGTVTSSVTVTPLNGFDGSVALASGVSLPGGVVASFQPGSGANTSLLKLAASSTTTTGVANAVAVSGTSGTLQHTVSNVILAVSAAVGDCGAGEPVDLSSDYNLTWISIDGTLGENAFSSDLLRKSRVLSGILFNFGPPNAPDAVQSAGQTIPLPAGHFTTLQMLGASYEAEGNLEGAPGQNPPQTIIVTYTDGTTSQFTQSFSGWFFPPSYANESVAVAMPYVNLATGGKEVGGPYTLWGYTFVLNRTKTVKSVTLPSNSALFVLAATLTTQNLGTQVDLSSAFNASGIYTDGTSIPASGGLNATAAAYSADLLGNEVGPSNVIANGVNFSLGPPNTPDAVYGSGQAVPLPAGHFSEMHLLATGVNGNQASQIVTVTYTDGTTSPFTQSFSDWLGPQNYPGESEAVNMGYLNIYSYGMSPQAVNLYEYTFPLDPLKIVKSLELPANRDVLALAVTLRDSHEEPGALCFREPVKPPPSHRP
jgi:hypothetical protein